MSIFNLHVKKDGEKKNGDIVNNFVKRMDMKADFFNTGKGYTKIKENHSYLFSKALVTRTDELPPIQKPTLDLQSLRRNESKPVQNSNSNGVQRNDLQRMNTSFMGERNHIQVKKKKRKIIKMLKISGV